MTLYEFSIIVGVMVGFAALRFGVPILIMWLLSVLSRRYLHV